MHRQGQSLLIIIASAVLWTNAARGEVDEMRRALLIGNDAYTGEVKELNNAYSDVELVAKALQRDWFNVKALKDASRDTILAEVRSFAISLKDRGPNVVGFFYYAGHGASDASSGENYLIPVNVQRVNAEIWVKSVKVADIVDILATAENSIQFVIFDACRDELGEARPETVRAGFTPMQQKAAMLVGYSTAPGKEAIDGDGDNGPYASALAEELTRPGLDALLVFANVQRSVWSKIKQDPWINHPTLPELYFAGPAQQDPAMRDKAHGLLKEAGIDEALGRSEQAAGLYEQAIDLLSNGGWSEDRTMASALSGLGFHYMRQKRYVRALPLFQRSLAIYRRSFAENHRRLLAIETGLSEIKTLIEKKMP